jgi:hypothetical protein
MNNPHKESGIQVNQKSEDHEGKGKRVWMRNKKGASRGNK